MPQRPTLCLPAPTRCVPTTADIAHDIARDAACDTRPAAAGPDDAAALRGQPFPSPIALPSDPGEVPTMTLARVRGGGGSRVAGVLPAQTVA